MDRAALGMIRGPIHSRQKSILVDQLSRPDQVLPTEWSLLPRVFNKICRILSCPHLVLFATWANAKLLLYVSPVLDPQAWKQDALHLQWDHIFAYAFSLFELLRQVISKVMESEGLALVLVAPLWPQKEWFADLLDLLVEEPLELPRMWNFLVQPHVKKYYRGLETLRLHTWSLSSELLERRAFREKLRVLQRQT